MGTSPASPNTANTATVTNNTTTINNFAVPVAVPAAAPVVKALPVATKVLSAKITMTVVAHHIVLTVKGAKAHSKVRWLSHRMAKGSFKTDAKGNGSVKVTTTKTGFIVITMGGTNPNGKSWAVTKTLWIATAKQASLIGHELAVEKSLPTVTTVTSALLSTNLASATSTPSTGVTLDGGDFTLLAISVIGGVGCVGGLVVSGRIGRRTKKVSTDS